MENKDETNVFHNYKLTLIVYDILDISILLFKYKEIK